MKFILLLSTLLACASVAPVTGSAGIIQNGALVLELGAASKSSNAEHTGASGRVELRFADLSTGLVKVTAKVFNTTSSPLFGAGATESYLTGFGFDLIDNTEFGTGSFTAGANLDNLLTPFTLDGQRSMEIGFTSIDKKGNGKGNGGGNANGDPKGGIKAGEDDSVSFQLVSSTLDAAGMLEGFSVAFQSDPVLGALMRFQSVNAGAGSDKLQYVPPEEHAPEPASLAIFGVLGLAGIASRCRRARKAKAHAVRAG
ncbi:PEP-CTERM sorting domain-containing protein [Allorhodopirellula solitaria]|uniref:PEP-CTERM sorting domain-containing protein n=1 Tax=Allorhodopirellula solitaria TaxID=2527987 RepID=UPI0016490BA8|nr:PEP-CTERM sorting domain-containing protein [Allorhodopirellula solitaria]